MLDKNDIDKEFKPVVAEVEKGRLLFFAKAIGEIKPTFTDEFIAIDNGYSALPVPPTFLFCLKMDVPDPFENYRNLGISLANMLHAKQSFTYHTPAVAGDLLTFYSHVADIYDKKGGALEFLVEKTKVVNQRDEHVADITTTLVIRN